MEGIVFKGPDLVAASTARSCGHGTTGDVGMPVPDGAPWHDGPEMEAAVLTSDVPGPFGAGAADGMPGMTWGAIGGYHDLGLVLLWGYLPSGDDRTWVLDRAT
jgi:hypothetical protein